MKALELEKSTEVSREVLITIDVPDRYVEVVEVLRSMETGSVIVQIVLLKEVKTYVDPEQNLNVSFRSLES